MGKGSEAIKVTIRVRPPSLQESARGEPIALNSHENILTLTRPDSTKSNLKCSYDAVLDMSATQADVFDSVRHCVEGVCGGVNGCVFSYGQTGAGKTHTMVGEGNTFDGIIPLSVQLLFDNMGREQSADAGGPETTDAERRESKYSIHCSFLQIYNEKLFDLLADGGGNLNIRETKTTNRNGKAEVFVSGLSEFRVTSAEDVLTLIQAGTRSRALRSTEMNDVSSRSHAVLQLSVESEKVGEDYSVIRRAKLSLVDLAGSEKMNTNSKMKKDHTNELTSINSSLSALGNVMSALSDKKRHHIPYRDSKLTRLLQDSLGGNTRTSIICCVSPCVSAVEETSSTLHFADRARKVMLHVRANEVVDDKVLLARAQSEIARLRMLLKKYMGGGSILGPNVGGNLSPGNTIEDLEKNLNDSPSKIRPTFGEKATSAAVEHLVQENAKLREQNRILRSNMKRYNISAAFGTGGRAEMGKNSSRVENGEHDNKDSVYRRKKRLPGNNNNNNDNKKSTKNRAKNLVSAYAGVDNDSNSEWEGDVDQLRRDLRKKSKAIKKSSKDASDAILKKVTEEHNEAVLDKDRIQRERELLESELAKMLREQREAGVEEDDGNNSMFKDDDDDDDDDDDGDGDGDGDGDDDGDGDGDGDREGADNGDDIGDNKNISNKENNKENRDESDDDDDGGGGYSEEEFDADEDDAADIENIEPKHVPTTTPAEQPSTGEADVVSTIDQQQTQAPTTKAPAPHNHKLMAAATYPASNRKNKRRGRKDQQGMSRTTMPGPPTVAKLMNQAAAVRRSKNKSNKGAGNDVSPDEVNLSFSMADLGMRIKVYSYRYDHYYPCTIVGFDHRRRMHNVLYDDGGEGKGEKQWHDLNAKKTMSCTDTVNAGGRKAKRTSASAPLKKHTSAAGKGGIERSETAPRQDE